MHARFAKTSNVKRFYDAWGRLQERGAEEASWLLTIGLPGFGKTRTVYNFAINAPAVYVRAKANWRPIWMLEEIANALGVDNEGSIKSLFKRIVPALVETGRPIVVDEARNMLHDAKLLETLRDLSDTTDAAIVLSGEDFVLGRLTTRYPQIRSRISEVVAFKAATVADVRVCCNELSEVPIADDLVAEIHGQSRGYLREVKNAISAAERVGKREGLPMVELQHVAGVRLCQDRHDIRDKAA